MNVAQDRDANHQNDLPHISINSQYIKDLSFENPGAPNNLSKLNDAPKVEIALDVIVSQISEENEDVFEVSLYIKVAALVSGASLFHIELMYSGVFVMQNFPNEHKHPALGIHCPAMLFPFARQIIANITQAGGFAPLMIDPIDFAALYQKKMMETEANTTKNSE